MEGWACLQGAWCCSGSGSLTCQHQAPQKNPTSSFLPRCKSLPCTISTGVHPQAHHPTCCVHYLQVLSASLTNILGWGKTGLGQEEGAPLAMPGGRCQQRLAATTIRLPQGHPPPLNLPHQPCAATAVATCPQTSTPAPAARCSGCCGNRPSPLHLDGTQGQRSSHKRHP